MNKDARHLSLLLLQTTREEDTEVDTEVMGALETLATTRGDRIPR